MSPRFLPLHCPGLPRRIIPRAQRIHWMGDGSVVTGNARMAQHFLCEFLTNKMFKHLLSKEPNRHEVSSYHTTCIPRACLSFALNQKPNLWTFFTRQRKWIVSFLDHSPQGHIRHFHYNTISLSVWQWTFGSEGQTLKEQNLVLSEEETKWPWESLTICCNGCFQATNHVISQWGWCRTEFLAQIRIVSSCRKKSCSDGVSSPGSVSITSNTWSRQGGILVQFSSGVNREK